MSERRCGCYQHTCSYIRSVLIHIRTACAHCSSAACQGEMVNFSDEAVCTSTAILCEAIMHAHTYKCVWSPAIGGVLSQEHDSNQDRFAVCVVNGELIVGHVPRWLTRTVLYFLGRSSEATCVFAQRSSSTVRTLVPRPYVQYKYIIQKFKNEGLAKVHVYLQPVAMWLL